MQEIKTGVWLFFISLILFLFLDTCGITESGFHGEIKKYITSTARAVCAKSMHYL
jgi:hypothetical protein